MLEITVAMLPPTNVTKPYQHIVHTIHRAANSTRIRESILATILVTLRYANQFLSFNYV